MTFLGIGLKMGPGRGASPGAFDALQLQAPAYGLYGSGRLVKSNIYTGPAYRGLRTSDSATQDFNPDTPADAFATWAQAEGPATPYGTIFYDQSGNARHSDGAGIGSEGTTTSAPTVSASVYTRPHFAFDGASGRRLALQSAKPFVNGKAAVTMGMVVRGGVADVAATGILAGASIDTNGNTIRAGLGVLNGTPDTFCMRGLRTDGGSTSSATATYDQLWHTLIGIFDWAGNIVKVYLDGVRISGTAIGGAVATCEATDAAGFFIGGMNTATFAAFDMFTLALYDSALSDGGVANDVTATGNVALLHAALLGSVS